MGGQPEDGRLVGFLLPFIGQLISKRGGKNKPMAFIR
jgi:hypothetical protein